MAEDTQQRHAFIALPKSATAPLKALETAAQRLGGLADLPEEHRPVAVATALAKAYHGTLVGAYGVGGEVDADIIALGVANFVAAVLRQLEDDADYELVTRMVFNAILDREGMRAANVMMGMLSGDEPVQGSA